MSAATPTKRRALGALDANVLTRSPSRSTAKLAAKSPSPLKKPAAVARHATTPSPPRKALRTPKRALDPDGDGVASPAFKKLCAATAASPVKRVVAIVAQPSVEDAEEDSPPASACRSLSPDASSLFDNSTINTSQLTNITEPDATTPIHTTAAAPPSISASNAADITALPPPRPRRVPPTREEFRQKAEILRLRLSLASYKVKTNQTDVPLDKLQVRPVPGMARRRGGPLLPSMSAHTVERATPVQYWYRSLVPALSSSSQEEAEGGENANEGGGGAGGLVTPPRKWRGPEEEARLTSSGLRGGAAKGLLSLSQASS